MQNAAVGAASSLDDEAALIAGSPLEHVRVQKTKAAISCRNR